MILGMIPVVEKQRFGKSYSNIKKKDFDARYKTDFITIYPTNVEAANSSQLPQLDVATEELLKQATLSVTFKWTKSKLSLEVLINLKT